MSALSTAATGSGTVLHVSAETCSTFYDLVTNSKHARPINASYGVAPAFVRKIALGSLCGGLQDMSKTGISVSSTVPWATTGALLSHQFVFEVVLECQLISSFVFIGRVVRNWRREIRTFLPSSDTVMMQFDVAITSVHDVLLALEYWIYPQLYGICLPELQLYV